ncbi:MAG TPA: CNNM domain-containing protein [Candidatus Saccharimonadales bacterium]|nr:CNNM domain-containing protein [Candidatus Saccharimonadales bacterium]
MLELASLFHGGHKSFLIYVGEVFLLVMSSAVCSGLNIAVMSLDPEDLRRKSVLGNIQAKKILPLRNRTHLLLASILLTNVAAVSATSLVLNQKLNGWVAGILATLLIVIFGEVIPQALFSKNALYWSSLFSPVLKLMIAITFPVSKPLELLLNRLFPRQKAKLQSRQELGLIMTEHLRNDSSELDDNEIEIVRGALTLSEKRVRDIMTPIRQTYWLTPDTPLDDAKIDEIKDRGFSRIPIFDKDLTKCYGVLLMKDLVDIDFDDNSFAVEDIVLYPAQLVGSMTALDTQFRKFISAGSHLTPIERDDRIVGIVTIEDLIEEIFGQEIEDETDRSRRYAK